MVMTHFIHFLKRTGRYYDFITGRCRNCVVYQTCNSGWLNEKQNLISIYSIQQTDLNQSLILKTCIVRFTSAPSIYVLFV